MGNTDYTVAGVRVDAVDLNAAVERFFALLSAGSGGRVCCTSSHGIVAARKDAKLARIMSSSDISLPDGVPMALVGKLRSRNGDVSRVPGPDFFEACIKDPRAKAARHYFYGGAPETVRAITDQASAIMGPNAIAGGYSPPLREVGALEDADVIARMQAAAPTIIWVGLSTPKQEYWMHNHARYFPNAVCIGIGAAFDFFANTKSRAPIAFQKIGCEWLFRLISEPRRLWPRYRQVVPTMSGIILKEFVEFATGKSLHRSANSGPPQVD